MRSSMPRQRGAQLGAVGADLDRREQQEAAVLGEDRPADLRAARQLLDRAGAAPAWRRPGARPGGRRAAGPARSCSASRRARRSCSKRGRSRWITGCAKVSASSSTASTSAAARVADAQVAQPLAGRSTPWPLMAAPASSRASWSPRVRRRAAGRPARARVPRGPARGAARARGCSARPSGPGRGAAPRGSAPWPVRSARSPGRASDCSRSTMAWRISRLALL